MAVTDTIQIDSVSINPAAFSILNLKNETKILMKTNKHLFNKNIEFIINSNIELMEKINELISFIMEWYIIAKIYLKYT